MSGLITVIRKFFQSPVISQQEANSTANSVDRIPVSQDSLSSIDYQRPTTEDLKKSLFVVQKPEDRIPSTLQGLLDARSPHENITLFPPNGEHEAPVTIRQPVTLDGQGGTIWGKIGTVVDIGSDRVRLKNLRIEATDPQSDRYAIRVASGKNATFENVEVRGMVAGISTEAGVWDYPESLNLGQLSHGCEHQFKLRIVVPLPCQIIDNIAGLDFFPRRLQPGANEVTLRLEQVPQDTLIFGSVFLVSDSLKRRITVSAQVLPLSHQTPTREKLIWEAKNWAKSLHSPLSPSTQKKYDLPESHGNSFPPTSPKIRRHPMPSSTSWLIDSSSDNGDRTVSGTSPKAPSLTKTGETIQNAFSVTNNTKNEKKSQNVSHSSPCSIPAIFLQENS